MRIIIICVLCLRAINRHAFRRTSIMRIILNWTVSSGIQVSIEGAIRLGNASAFTWPLVVFMPHCRRIADNG